MNCAGVAPTSEILKTTTLILLLKVRDYKDEKVCNGVMFIQSITKINLLETRQATR
jgi:hypothetical protein